MNPVGTIDDLQQALGASLSYASAVKRAAGYAGRRKFPVQEVVAWYRSDAAKGFTQSKAYRDKSRPRSKSNPRVATASKQNG